MFNLTIETTTFLPGDTRVSCQAIRRRPIFGAKIEAWSHKMFYIFHSLQKIWYCFGDYKSLSVNIYAISNERTFIDDWKGKCFPLAESWLAKSNFRGASRIQGMSKSNLRGITLGRRTLCGIHSLTVAICSRKSINAIKPGIFVSVKSVKSSIDLHSSLIT